MLELLIVSGGISSDLLKHVDIYGNVVSVGMIAGLDLSSSVLPHIIRGVNSAGC